MLKRNEIINQKNIMDDYKYAISHKKQLMGVEKDIEHLHAK